MSQPLGRGPKQGGVKQILKSRIYFKNRVLRKEDKSGLPGGGLGDCNVIYANRGITHLEDPTDHRLDRTAEAVQRHQLEGGDVYCPVNGK